MKENDMVAIMLFNPGASMLDLDASGINSTNTGIKDEKEYLKLKLVTENTLFQDSLGNFSENKFHEFYLDALRNYNVLANGGWQPTFEETNIFAPQTLIKNEPTFKETLILNPFRQTISMKDIGEFGPQTKSIREIAEGQKVFDTATGKWLDTPEESFFGTLGMGPLVLAQWDFDADENGNPTSDPEKIKYKKGDYKYNDNGTFYYETLNGRNMHGKQVLHYSDVITKEGSNWNKIDFLDSDDIEKSVMGTAMKNVALVGSLFLPFGIGYAVTGATILQQSLKLGTTLGKMLLGSDNKFMNSLQAFSDATNLLESKSDYALQKVWSWENLISTAGDAISLLRQLRVLFEVVPWMLGYGKLGKGKGIFSNKGLEELQQKLISKYNSTPLTLMRDKFSIEGLVVAQLGNAYNLLMQAAIDANNITKNLTTLSGAVSKAYMTGITVLDMFDEAVNAGMSDLGAMAMTLGYAAAEYALLSTGIGELILPELRFLRMYNKMLLLRLSDKTVQTLNSLEREARTEVQKLNFIQRAFNTGKRLYEDNRAGLTGASINALVGGVGEGVEEITEEALADTFRIIHDLAKFSSGKMFNGEDWLDRYGMNFVGGLIGGGVNGIATDFSLMTRVNTLSPEEALKELIYKMNNGEINDIRKSIETTKWASEDLSALNVIKDEKTGNNLWAQGTKEDNQNEYIKNMLRNQVESVYNVLTANGAKITNDEFFNYNTLKQSRFAMLANTSTAARYTEEYTLRLADLVSIYQQEELLDKTTLDDTKKEKSENTAEREQYEQKKKELADRKKEVLQYIKDIKEGKLAARFIGTALLEIHPAIAQAFITGPTLDLYVQRTDPGHRHFKDLTEAEQTEYVNKYKAYKGGMCKEELIKAYDTWEYIMDAVLSNFAPNVSKYQEELDIYTKFLDLLLDTTVDYVNDPKAFTHLANVINSYFDGTEATYIDTKINNSEELLKEFDENKKLAEKKAQENEEKFNKQLEDFLNDLDARILIAKDAQTNEINSKYDALILAIDSTLTPEQITEETNRINSERQEELNNILNILEEKYKFTEERKNKEDSINNNRKNAAKSIAAEESYNNERAALKSLINSMHSVLQTMKNRGYLNQVTKDKLQKVKLGLDNLIKIMNTYMLDIGGLGYTDIDNDSFIFALNLHLGNDGEEYLDFLDLFGEVSPVENEEGLYTPEILTKGKAHEVSDMISEILETPESPILLLLDSFALDVLGKQTNFSALLKDINTIVDTVKTVGPRIIPNMALVDLTTVIPSIDLAILLGDLLYATLMGARSDSAGYEANKLLSSGTPNFGFHFGINSIINEVRKKMGDDRELLTIEGEVTDNIVKDLHTLIKNLKFYKDLYAINSGQKLATQSKIALRATLAIYKALRRLCDVAPDDFDKTPLDVFFQEGNIILENLEKELVDDALLVLIEAERIKMEDALYEIGQNPNNLGKCFFNIEKLPDLFKNNSLILNESTKEIDMQSMIGYVLSRMTIKASDFYNTFRLTISDKVAPLSIQELSVYLCVANALNGDRITSLKNVVRSEMLKYLRSLTEEKRIALFTSLGYKEGNAKLLGSNTYLPYLEELDTIPSYDNISFVEGIAGSGKTRAVLLMAKEVIKAVAPQILDNVFIADITKKGAEDLGEKGLNLEDGKFKGFDKEELLQHISNWKAPSIEKGEYQFKEGVDYRIENGKVVPAYTLKEGVEVPSLIIIDEVGRYTDLELKLIDQFAKKHGITVLTFGDLDLNKARGDVNISIDKENLKRLGINYNESTMPMNIGIQRGLLLHGSKLGFSMRTRNIQLDKNLNLIQAKINNPSGDINLSYFEGIDEDGKYILNGTKVVNEVKAAVEVVEKLSKNLKEGEKIGFIYESEESPLYKELMEKYSAILQPYHKYNAQGREARYFIMELVPNNNDEQLIEELYTGITRALDGMVLMTTNPMHSEGIYKILNLAMDTIRKELRLDPKDVKDFSKKRRNMYDSIFKDSTNTIEYKERTKVEELAPIEIPTFTVRETREDGDQFIVEVEPTSIEDSEWLKDLREDKNIVTTFTSLLDGTNVIVTIVNAANETKNIHLPGILTDYVNVVLPEEPLIGVEGQNNAILNPPPPPPKPNKPIVTPSSKEWDAANHSVDSRNDKMPIMVYTCASMELGGWVKGTDGKPKATKPVSPNRIDSINGLLKIAPPNTDFDILYEALFKLHNAINTCTNRNDLNAKIIEILKILNPNISDNISLQFGLWSSSTVNTTPPSSSYSIYERGVEERSLFNEIEDLNINNQNLALAVKIDGKFLLMIPFGFLSSPFTIALMYNNGNNPVMTIIHKHGKHNLNDAVEEILNDHSIYQNYPALYNLFKLYRFTHNGFFPIKLKNATGTIELGWETSEANSFVPNSSLSNFGILVIQDRGMRLINDEIYQWHSVKSKLPTVLKEDLFSVEELINDKRLHYSLQVYMFNSNSVVDSSGNNKPILRGRPFLLVSEKEFFNDEDMFDAFLNNDENVKLIYLMPPSLTLKDYMRKAYEADATKSGEYPGNDTTSFYILRELLKTDAGTEFLKRRLEDVYDGGRKGLFAKVKFVVDTLSTIYDKCYNEDVLDRQLHNGCRTQNNFSEFIEALKGEIGEENNFFNSLTKVNYKLNKIVRLLVNASAGKISLRGNKTILIDENLLNELDSLVGNINIYENIKFLKNVQAIKGIALPILADGDSNYKYRELFLQTDVRVTPATFGTLELNGFIDSLVNYYIHPSTSTLNSKLDNTLPDESLHKNFIGNSVVVYQPNILNNLIQNVKNKLGHNIINKSTIKNALEEQEVIDGIIRNINNNKNIKGIIVKIGNDYKIKQIPDSIPITSSKTFDGQTLIIDGVKYIITPDGNLIQQQKPLTNILGGEPSAYNPEDTLDDLIGLFLDNSEILDWLEAGKFNGCTTLGELVDLCNQIGLEIPQEFKNISVLSTENNNCITINLI